MDAYLLTKWLHILSSTFLFGTGIGSAYYMLLTSLRARRTGDARSVAVVAEFVVLADWLFTTTTIIVQPLSGFYLLHLAGMPWTSRWIAHTLLLYLLAGACWLPVVWMQIRMRDMARAAAEAGQPLPPRYWRFLVGWTLLGIPAFIAFVVIFYLMVAKPM